MIRKANCYRPSQEAMTTPDIEDFALNAGTYYSDSIRKMVLRTRCFTDSPFMYRRVMLKLLLTKLNAPCGVPHIGLNGHRSRRVPLKMRSCLYTGLWPIFECCIQWHDILSNRAPLRVILSITRRPVVHSTTLCRHHTATHQIDGNRLHHRAFTRRYVARHG